jgi:FkbM family methyltransferase
MRKGRLFPWRMHNGALLAISPFDGAAYAGTVGWTCFEYGIWEAHIEHWLRRLLHHGDTALDVGANIGYFSAVMAQSVGPHGKIWAFEPVPMTFRQASLCSTLNHYRNLEVLPVALGNEDGHVTVAFDPRVTAQASIYHTEELRSRQTVAVDICRLDSLVTNGSVGLPNLVKIDVEGYEYSVVAGAHETISKAVPHIIFEFNAHMAAKARWSLTDIALLLRTCGNYRFLLIEKKTFKLVPIDIPGFTIGDDEYVDILAISDRRALTL